MQPENTTQEMLDWWVTMAPMDDVIPEGAPTAEERKLILRDCVTAFKRKLREQMKRGMLPASWGLTDAKT